jgi:hypothetical protein
MFREQDEAFMWKAMERYAAEPPQVDWSKLWLYFKATMNR